MIGLQGAKALANALRHENNQLQILKYVLICATHTTHLLSSLGFGQIGPEGAEALAGALMSEHNKIQSLECVWECLLFAH